MKQQHPPRQRPKWEAFKRNFRESNYITDFWNWLLTLLSKSTEMVLFGTVLYSGYQLFPGVWHAPAAVDGAIFVIQQGALDIGGLGLMKLARRAGLPKESFPMRIGITLVGLMIANVVLATTKQAFPMLPPTLFLVVEAVLPVARAVMAVVFGHAIHALREEYEDSTITVKEANDLQRDIERLTTQLTEQRTMLANELRQERTNILNELQRTVAELRQDLDPRLESIQALERGLHTVASLVTQQGQALADLSEQTQTPHETKRGERPANEPSSVSNVRYLRTPAPNSEHQSEKGAFVRACLAELPTIRNSDIQRKAKERGLSISAGYISDIRKALGQRGQEAVQ